MDDPVQQRPYVPQQPQPSVHPVAGVSKEAEIMPVKAVDIVQIPEYERPSEVPPPIEVVKAHIDVPADLTAIGVSNSPHDVPAIQATQGTTPSMPLTDDQIGEGLSKKPSSSFRWLAEWCRRQLMKLHITLQKVQGHFIRVKER